MISKELFVKTGPTGAIIDHNDKNFYFYDKSSPTKAHARSDFKSVNYFNYAKRNGLGGSGGLIKKFNQQHHHLQSLADSNSSNSTGNLVDKQSGDGGRVSDQLRDSALTSSSTKALLVKNRNQANTEKGIIEFQSWTQQDIQEYLSDGSIVWSTRNILNANSNSTNQLLQHSRSINSLLNHANTGSRNVLKSGVSFKFFS